MHTFERPVKSMSAAGTKPGDLDFELRWFVIQKLIVLTNIIRSQFWYARDAGFRARPSAPFCVDKREAKSTPVIAPFGFPLSILLHRDVGKTRYRSNRLPTTIALTFIAFGAAEREGLAAK
ncbi:hypothetical protein HTZ97_11075 [Desulfuromonas acetoxidans]|uniref:hypothetical protein n=2 Tax=Desulfuromonas acetoxidans TaxID=891 RepID=UPI0003242F5F|nr:hypothetical protein [Desulfuromonas acetoxidans]NVE17008.1 hypothetical protein [Desulfuromonas acetoxidans]